MARISTHVLDLASGKPAAGIAVELRHGGELIATSVTNNDGRTSEPLASGDALRAGHYELTFYIKAYFTPTARFFDDIVIRFEVEDAGANYHVPLLLSPFGYSTYRGS